MAFALRAACDDDQEDLALISWERLGGDLEKFRAGTKRKLSLPPEKLMMFVAYATGSGAESEKLLGFGSAEWLEWSLDRRLTVAASTENAPAADVESDRKAAPHVPASWYLTGVVVRSHARRAGIGRALTEARIREWRAQPADVAGDALRFVVNARNGPSIDLHRELGFEVEAGDFWMPGVTFTGGEGFLFRLAR